MKHEILIKKYKEKNKINVIIISRMVVMIYLFYGIEDYLIQKEIDNIKQKNNIEEISISRYDLTNTNIEKIIEDCEMNSMFTDKKGYYSK